MSHSTEFPVDNGSDSWRQHLAALPEVNPPDALWQRLQQARGSTSSLRPRWPWAAAAAAAALVAVLILPRTDTPVSVFNQGPEQSLPPAISNGVHGDTGLRRLDDELARAYALNADETQIAALWQTRARLIESLESPTPALLARL